jgi:AraC-like DNA-binding protein
MITWAHRCRDWSQLARLSHFSCQRMASRLGISQRQLQRHFQEIYQLELRDWITSVRLGDARHLLGKQRLVKEVAYLLGYKQVSHFSRQFKKMFGIAPEKFAESKSIGNPQFEATYMELLRDKFVNLRH